MALEIRLLGGMTVLRSGEALSLPASRKTRALLGYLVATAKPHRRGRLCSLLFDGPDDPRGGLRWSLSKLRAVVDEEGSRRLVTTRDEVGFDARGALVDVADLRAAAAKGIEALPEEPLRALAARFGGELLEGIDLPDCWRFQEWVVAAREEMRALEADRQLPLQLALLRILVLSRTRRDATERVRRMLSDVLAEAGRRGMADLMAEGFMVLAIVDAEGGRYEAAEETARQAAEAGRSARDRRVAAFAFAATARCLAMLDRDIPRARALVGEARALTGSPEEEDVEIPLGLGLLAAHDGDAAAAAAHVARALAKARAAEDRWREYLSLAFLARLQLEIGDAPAARATCRELVPVARRMGEGSEAAVAESIDALAARALGEPGGAERLESALTALRDVDTKADLGWALVAAGELDLAAGDALAARARGEEALRHAELLRRASDEGMARALLCRALAALGERAPARQALSRFASAGEEAGLSARARAALAWARAALAASAPAHLPFESDPERRTSWTT